MIYVSPYISIADQNAQVVREVLEPAGCDFASIVLEHHSNLTEEKESWRGSVLAENWDAPSGFHDGGAGARSALWRRDALGTEASRAR